MADINKILVISAAVRGFHVYHEVCNPQRINSFQSIHVCNNNMPYQRRID